MMLKQVFLTLALSCTMFSAIAGPFGLEMGMTKEQMKALGISLTPDPKSPDWYITKRTPKGLEEFEEYHLWISPAAGLCKLYAIGRDVELNAFGDRLKTEFSEIREMLVQVYGAPEDYDFLRKGSIWDDPEEWAMSIVQEERMLASIWTDDKNKLKDSIQAIKLEGHALKLSEGYLTLAYEFTNHNRCAQNAENRRKGVL